MKFKFYFICCVVIVLSMFGLSSFYGYGIVCHLVATFYLHGAIQTSKTDLINQIYQIIVSMLKNENY